MSGRLSDLKSGVFHFKLTDKKAHFFSLIRVFVGLQSRHTNRINVVIVSLRTQC